MRRGILLVFVIYLTLSILAAAKDSHSAASGNAGPVRRPEARIVGIEYPANLHVSGAFLALSHARGGARLLSDAVPDTKCESTIRRKNSLLMSFFKSKYSDDGRISLAFTRDRVELTGKSNSRGSLNATYMPDGGTTDRSVRFFREDVSNRAKLLMVRFDSSGKPIGGSLTQYAPAYRRSYVSVRWDFSCEY